MSEPFLSNAFQAKNIKIKHFTWRSMICKFEILAKGNDDIIGKEWCSVGSGFDVKKCTVQKSNYASHTAAFNQDQ